LEIIKPKEKIYKIKMVNFHKIYVLQHSAKNEKEYTERRKQILLNLAVGNITADKIKFVKC
jgi:hypothetical protein